MLKRALVAIALVCGFALVPFTARPESAWADTPTASDAGAGSGSFADAGSAAVPAPAPAHVCTLDGKAIECAQLVEHPAESVSEVRTLWKDGSAVPAIILALFLLFSWASKHIDWLGSGHRAAFTASGLAGLTILAEPASRGTTPTMAMVISALGAAFLLFTKAKKPPTTTGDQSPS